MVKISIIVPVYNVEKYIQKCLESLINQTLKDIEIILVNDGSTDNSVEIINLYQKKDNRIILINQKNNGQGSARNKGLEIAQGTYISFVDSDDYIEINMLEKMYKLATKEKADICFCNQKRVNEKYQITGYDTLNINGKFGNISTNSNLLLLNMGPCNKIYKNTFLKKNNLKFPITKLLWYEDLPFVAETILNAKKICWTDDYLYNYLQRDNSTMNNTNIKKNLDIISSFDILNQNPNINRKFKNELELLCLLHVYVYTIVRVIKIKSKNKEVKKIIKNIKLYLTTYYLNHKKNKYLKILPRNTKIIYYLLNSRLYFIIKLIFNIKEKFSQK